MTQVRAGNPEKKETEVEVAGERIRLLPELAVFWVRRNTLIIADLHLGKSAALRADSIPIPAGTTAEDLERINRILERTGAERLLFLGDVLHSKNARKNLCSRPIALWRSTWKELVVTVVRGNHDVQAGNLPEQLSFVYADGPLFETPFAFSHQPCFFADYYNLAGHLHPAVRLVGKGRQRERLPCFVFGEKGGVIPAFGALTGNLTIRPRERQQVYVVADNQVVKVSQYPE